MKRITIVLTLLLAAIGGFNGIAQRLEWNVDFNTVFDNREGDNKMTDTKTFFHTQLAPEIGISMFNGEHRLMGGVVWTQPIGCEWYDQRVSPTLYYRYKGARGWSMAMGMFPRTLLHRELPNYIWNDSIKYTQRNIRGAMTTYEGRNGFFEALIDWRSMQSETRREAFNIIAQGEWQRPGRIFLAGGLAMMNHFAMTYHPSDDQHIVDNFIVNPYVGLDFTQRTPLDSLTVRVGALSSITRNRATDKGWKVPTGAWVDIALKYKWFAWHNTTYVGKTLFPYYSDFGPLLDQGEPYYRSKWYNKSTFYGTILSNGFMNLQASLDFNLADNNFTFYQRLILRVYIDSDFKKITKNSPKLKPSFGL
ncbi:MAG: hypothetical protein K2N28_07990 [Muribaculaceae bacterium]|nr:hypothetical protein [Muribaculaceae bacterium]